MTGYGPHDHDLTIKSELDMLEPYEVVNNDKPYLRNVPRVVEIIGGKQTKLNLGVPFDNNNNQVWVSRWTWDSNTDLTWISFNNETAEVVFDLSPSLEDVNVTVVIEIFLQDNHARAPVESKTAFTIKVVEEIIAEVVDVSSGLTTIVEEEETHRKDLPAPEL